VRERKHECEVREDVGRAAALMLFPWISTFYSTRKSQGKKVECKRKKSHRSERQSVQTEDDRMPTLFSIRSFRGSK